MSTAEEQTYAALSAWVPLTLLVGDQIYPDEMPQGKTPPAVVFERTGTQAEITLDNVSMGGRVQIMVTCWVKGEEGGRFLANKIAREISAAMLDAKGEETDRSSQYVAEANEYAVAMSFDIWE